MTDALRYEWTRIRTIRSTWWLTGSAVVVGVGISLLLSIVFRNDFADNPSQISPDELDGLGAIIVTQLSATGLVPSLVGFLMAMVGIFAWGHEYRHGMIRASLTALPSRTSFWVAKFVVVGGWVLVTQLLTLIVSGLIGSALLGSYISVLDAGTWQVIAWQLLSTLLLTWMAMAFTLITRSQAFALVAIFLWPLLVESLVNVFFTLVPGLRDHTDVLRFLPFSAQRRMVGVLTEADSTFGDPLSALGGAVVFGGVAVVLMAVGYVLFSRRDA